MRWVEHWETNEKMFLKLQLFGQTYVGLEHVSWDGDKHNGKVYDIEIVLWNIGIKLGAEGAKLLQDALHYVLSQRREVMKGIKSKGCVVTDMPPIIRLVMEKAEEKANGTESPKRTKKKARRVPTKVQKTGRKGRKP